MFWQASVSQADLERVASTKISTMKVSQDDPRPPYLQVADDLRRAIEEGEYQVGQRLPAGRTLAKQYQVGLNTAQRAVELLKSDGLVVSYPARGVFVSSREPAPKQEGESSPEFVEIMRQIDLLKAGLRDVQERLGPLEEAIQNSQR
jgi:GntR family transcriptional regulator